MNVTVPISVAASVAMPTWSPSWRPATRKSSTPATNFLPQTPMAKQAAKYVLTIAQSTNVKFIEVLSTRDTNRLTDAEGMNIALHQTELPISISNLEECKSFA